VRKSPVSWKEQSSGCEWPSLRSQQACLGVARPRVWRSLIREMTLAAWPRPLSELGSIPLSWRKWACLSVIGMIAVDVQRTPVIVDKRVRPHPRRQTPSLRVPQVSHAGRAVNLGLSFRCLSSAFEFAGSPTNCEVNKFVLLHNVGIAHALSG